MATEFKIPELGENVTAGDVVRILVKTGDAIEKDQTVLELETDKATIEVPSNVSGTVADIKVKPGDKVKVGQVVLTLGEAAAEGAGKPAPAAAAGSTTEQEKAGAPAAKKGSGGQPPRAAAKPKAQPTGAPEEGGLSQAAAPGRTGASDGAEAGAAAADGGDERGDDSRPAPSEAGTGSRSEPGTDARSEPGTEERSKPATAAQSEDEPDDADDADDPRPAVQRPRGEVVDINRGARPAQSAPAARGPAAAASPSVRRVARELGVDIAVVAGTGADGRISTEDVQAYVRATLSRGGARGGGGVVAEPALPDFSKWGEVERKPMSNIRRKTAEHLSHAWQAIPHVTQVDRADITAVEGLRKRYAPQAEKAGGKLTMTAIALKIVAGALRRFPQFNSSLDLASGEIIYKSSIHVGVAADTPRGLLVPVVRDVDRKGIFELAKDLAALSEKARSGKLSLDEMQGGGFTITNLGGIGGTSFTPIVNWPEVAILGVSRSSWEPVWRPASVEDEGAFEPRFMLPLSLSYDHRVIDGADAARFLRWICEAFEQPFVLSL